MAPSRSPRRPPLGRPAPPNAIDKVRTRLAEGREPAQDFDYDLLHMFVRNEIGAVLTIPLLAIIIGLASMFWAPPHEALIWLGTLLICRFLMMRYIREFERTPKHDIDIIAWRKTLTSIEALYGLCWAGVALVGIERAIPAKPCL